MGGEICIGGNKTSMIVAWLFLFLLAAGTAYFADKKGRNPLGWFLLTLLLGMIAPVLLYFLGDQSVSPPKPPTPPLPQEPSPAPLVDWYYLDQNRQTVGPVSALHLQDLQNKGSIGPNTYLWKEGMENWQKMGDCFQNSLNEYIKNTSVKDL